MASYEAVGPSKGGSNDSNPSPDARVTVTTSESDPPEYGTMSYVLIGLSYVLVVLTFPIALFLSIKIVQEYQRAVIYRLGRIRGGKAAGPGLFFILPCTDTFVLVDMRTVSVDLPRQEVLSKDSVSVAVDAAVYFKIFDAVISVNNINNARYSTRLLAETTLRTVLGTHSLADILSQRETLTGQMTTMLDVATDPWGIKVERIEMKDVRLPMNMQRAMAAEAEATREAKAKVIAAEGEQNASRALKSAADVMAESPVALQLRYMQTLANVSAAQNHTIVFPVPTNLMKNVFGAIANKPAQVTA